MVAWASITATYGMDLDLFEDFAQIIYVDLRGQGRSGRPPLETATLEKMADDVAELISMLGIHMPYIFGHSAGGFVAMHLALRHKGSVAGLILTGTSPTVAPIQGDRRTGRRLLSPTEPCPRRWKWPHAFF